MENYYPVLLITWKLPGNLLPYLRIASFLFVFLGLYFSLILVNKILSWTSEESSQIGKKLYLQSAGFILFFTLWWLLLDLPEFNLQSSLVKISGCIVIFFAALLILDFLHYFYFDYYSVKVIKIRVPLIISNLIRAIYFIAIVLFILQMFYHLDIRPFLTGSAILTAIIGLALQDTIGNLISGLALHISRPFDINHWIKFRDLEGVVVKIDWRATTIKTRTEDYITIPNSHIAKSEVMNYSAPTTIHGQRIEVGVRYQYPPSKVKKVLVDSALATDGVVKNILPIALMQKYNEFSIDYSMMFFIDNYEKAGIIRSAVMEKIWYMFKRENIEIPFPIRDIYMKEEKKDEKMMDELRHILTAIDFFQNLNKKELDEIITRVKLVIYCKDEEIIRQGDKGDTFFIIKSGSVNVIAKNDCGEVFLSTEMKPGDFFGEISVLTGEPRTATVIAKTDVEVLVLNKADFEFLLKKNPDMDKSISEKIAERQKHTFEQMELAKCLSLQEAENKAQEKVASLSQQILGKIRNFFSIH